MSPYKVQRHNSYKTALRVTSSTLHHDRLTENAGRENDGPSKLQGMKLQDVKMKDQFAGHEIARPKMTTGRGVAGEKSRLSTEIALQ